MTTDTTIFQNTNNVIKCAQEPNIVDGCDALKRLISVVTYCSKFDLINNENDQHIFSNFISNLYKDFLNDYIHLIDKHCNQLQKINDRLKRNKMNICNLETCIYSQRHNNDENYNNNKVDQDDNSLISFYIATIDSLHFYLFHLFECGLRVADGTKYQQNDNKENEGNVDLRFSTISDQISQCRKTTETFARFQNNYKFNIQVENKSDHYGVTFMDALIEYLSNNDSNETPTETLTLNEYIQNEEFDTDAIKMDVATSSKGNISTVCNAETMRRLMQFINTNKSMNE